MNSFTTEIPAFALNTSKGADRISFEIRSGKQKVAVEILPDEEGFVATGGAFTEQSLSYNTTSYETKSGEVTTLPIFSFLLTLKTTYKHKINPLSQSGYGRGTTKADVKSKNISLRFHESQHGLQVMNFIKIYPLPVPQMHLHMAETELQQLVSKFKTYTDTLNRRNKAEVDCIGTLPEKGYNVELDAICWPTKPRKRAR